MITAVLPHRRLVLAHLGFLMAFLFLALCLTPLQAAGKDPSLPLLRTDPHKVALGMRLFFDPRLSGDGAISCATCHIPGSGFADGLPLSRAYPGSLGFRNTPSLINTAYRKAWFHDGRVAGNLEDVVLESISGGWMMSLEPRLLTERLKQDPDYVRMFAEAGYAVPAINATLDAITDYLKTLVSRGSDYDNGQMTDAARRGQVLFRGKAGCANCHSGPLFSDGLSHATGVPETPGIWNHPIRHTTFVAYARELGISGDMDRRSDPGVHFNNPEREQAEGPAFMTPTLRELTFTAPYMHNGIFATLRDVVDFYDRGIAPLPDRRLKPLGLSRDEKNDLIAFLEALSGLPLTGEDFVWKQTIPTDYPLIDDWRSKSNIDWRESQ